VALFDIASAELANCHLYQVQAVNLKFSMAANPYYMTKYCETEERKTHATAALRLTHEVPFW
jgi:hypothetical protein